MECHWDTRNIASSWTCIMYDVDSSDSGRGIRRWRVLSSRVYRRHPKYKTVLFTIVNVNIILPVTSLYRLRLNMCEVVLVQKIHFIVLYHALANIVNRFIITLFWLFSSFQLPFQYVSLGNAKLIKHGSPTKAFALI